MTTPPPPLPQPPVPADQNPYASPFPPQPAPGYGAPPQGMPAPGYGFPPPPPGQGPMCRFCGSVPAVEATIRGHQGLVIIMWFRYVHGPFCRSCGIATHREMTTRSLWQGWWSVFSMFINPITMLINVPQRLKINKLPPPIPGSPGTPMPVGKPVLARPAAWVALVPIIVIGIIIAPLTRAVMNDPTYADVGDCLHNSGTMSSPDLEVTDCGGSQAEYKVVGKLSGTTDIDRCRQFADQGSEIGYYQQQGSSRFVLCLAPAEG